MGLRRKFLNKNGFTLVEMVGVLVVLSILGIVAFGFITNKLKNVNDGLDDSTRKIILSKTEDYVNNNMNNFASIEGNVYCIPLQTLVDEGILNIDIKDIETGEPYDLTKEIQVNISNGKFVFLNIQDADDCEPVGEVVIPPAPPIAVGDYLKFGTYYDTDVIWRVFKMADVDLDGQDEIYIISAKVIMGKVFDASGDASDGGSYGGSYWPTSSLREWLNSTASAGNVVYTQNPPSASYVDINPYDQESGFISSDNFTANEVSIIKPVTHLSRLASSYSGLAEGGNTYMTFPFMVNADDTMDDYWGYIGGDATYYNTYYLTVTDMVFAPSYEEIYQMHLLYPDDSFTRVGWTEEANANSAHDMNEYPDQWFFWARDGLGSYQSLHYPSYGMGSYVGRPTTGKYGVRPAMYIDINGLTRTGSGASYEDPYVISW